MAITTIGLILGYQCNIRCRHCLWGDTLEDKTVMSIDDAKRYIDMAVELETVRLLGFTGGETFLFKQVMRHAMYYGARRYGLPSCVATNSSWAVNLDKARRILDELYRIGLRRLQLSLDDFHQEFVPLERVKTVLTVAAEMKIKSTLVCIVSAKSRKLADYLAELEVEPGPLIEVAEAPVTPTGFAAERIAVSDLPQLDGVPSNFCTMLNVLNVLPDGSVQTCCGAPFSMPSLKAGNAKQRLLKDIVEEARWNPVFNALALGKGPRILEQTLKASGEDGFLKRGCYASTCDACQHIMGNRKALDHLYAALEPRRTEMFVDRYLANDLATNILVAEADEHEARKSQESSQVSQS